MDCINYNLLQMVLHWLLPSDNISSHSDMIMLTMAPYNNCYGTLLYITTFIDIEVMGETDCLYGLIIYHPRMLMYGYSCTSVLYEGRM
jgi:hypothetical protein